MGRALPCPAPPSLAALEGYAKVLGKKPPSAWLSLAGARWWGKEEEGNLLWRRYALQAMAGHWPDAVCQTGSGGLKMSGKTSWLCESGVTRRTRVASATNWLVLVADCGWLWKMLADDVGLKPPAARLGRG